MSSIDQSKTMTTAQAAALLMQPIVPPNDSTFMRWIDLWNIVRALEAGASQMSNEVEGVPRTSLRAQLGTAKARAASGQALLTYANQFVTGSWNGLTLPTVDRAFSGLAAWFKKGTAADEQVLLMPESTIETGGTLLAGMPGYEAQLQNNPSSVMAPSPPTGPPPFFSRMKNLVARYNAIAVEVQALIR